MYLVCYTYHQTNVKNLKDDWLRALLAFPEDISSVLGAHIGGSQPPTASTPGHLITSSGLWDTHTHMHTYANLKNT